MRVTVLILSLLLGAIMFIQTFLGSVASDLANDEGGEQSSAVGLMMALLWLIAAAFVIPFPMVSVVLFALAGLFGFAGSGDFPDLAYWGGISLVLSVLSFFSWRGKRKATREANLEKKRQLERDDRLEQMLRERAH